MNITAQQLSESIGCPLERAQKWLDALNAAMDEFEINTPERIAAFLAQIGHESGRLVYVREIWGPTSAQSRYEGRADLGNVFTGDGVKYKGRGLLQTTGRDGYKRVSSALVIDFETHPELLEEPTNAARSAGWFWKTHGCNEFADAGEFTAITKRINGGLNGQQERVALWDSAKAALLKEA